MDRKLYYELRRYKIVYERWNKNPSMYITTTQAEVLMKVKYSKKWLDIPSFNIKDI